MASSILSPRRLLFGLLLLAGCYGWWVASQYQQLNSLNQRQLADVAVELKSTIETAFQNIKLYEPQPGNTSAACDFDYDQPYLESVDACGDEWTRWLQPQLSVSAGVQVLATRGFSDPNAAELATAARLEAKQSARIEGQVTFRFRADLLLAELPFTERFERLLLVNGNGKVIYQEDPRLRRRLRLLRWGERGFADARAGETRGVRIQSIADLLGKDANPNWVQLKAVSDRTTAELGGTRFHLYTHPLGIEAGTDSDLVLIGAVPVSDVLRQALAFDTYLFATLVFLALVGALGFPFIKLAAIGAHERLRMRDVRWLYVSCAAVVVVGTFAVLAADSYQRWAAAGDRGLVQLAQKIETRLLKEIDDVTSALVDHDRAAARLVPGPKCTPMDVVADWFNKPGAPAELGFTRNDGIYLDQVAWVDPSGQQIWKITSDRIGEKVKVAKRTYYRAVRDGHLYEHGEGRPPFFIGPDRSITDGKFYTFVSMPSTLTTQPCPLPSGADAGRDAAGGEDPIGNSSGDPYVAVATARLLSVDRVALPAEYGFVVINRDGRVLYHSDGRLSLRENFFDELSQGPVARSVVYGGNDAPLSTRYREMPHRVYFHRLGLRPHGAHESKSDPALDTASLYLATFRDVSTERAVISRTFVLSLLGPFPFLLAMMIGGIAAAGSVSARIDGRRDHWLWPQAAFQSLYRRQAGVYGAALASAFLLDWLGAGTWAFVVLPSSAIVGGLIAYRRDGPHRAPRFALEQPIWHMLQFSLLALGIVFVPAAAMFDATIRHEFGTMVATERRWVADQIADARREMEAEARAERLPVSVGTNAAMVRTRSLGGGPEPFDADPKPMASATEAIIRVHEWLDQWVPFGNEHVGRLRYQSSMARYSPPGLFGPIGWFGAGGLLMLAIAFVAWLRWTTTRLLYANVQSLAELEPELVDAEWEKCSLDERHLLMQIADEGIANPRQRAAVLVLMRKGLVRLNPHLELSSERVSELVRRARDGHASTYALQHWERVHEGRNWHDTRLMLLASLAVIAALVATQPGLPSELAAVASGVAALGGAGLKVRDMFTAWVEKTRTT